MTSYASSTFNTANLSSTITESSDTYTLVYTVGDGDPNIFNATSVPGTFTKYHQVPGTFFIPVTSTDR